MNKIKFNLSNLLALAVMLLLVAGAIVSPVLAETGTDRGRATQPDLVGNLVQVDSDAVHPTFTVFVSSDFTTTWEVTGFAFIPGSQVTLEIDNGADGTVDFSTTNTVDQSGDVRFPANDQFSVHEADLIRLYDDQEPQTVKTHVVDFITLTEVNKDADTLRGHARQGTQVFVRVFDPELPFPEGPDRVATADPSENWEVNFGGTIDIAPGTSGWVQTVDEDGDHTQINWRVPKPWFMACITNDWIYYTDFSSDVSFEVYDKPGGELLYDLGPYPVSEWIVEPGVDLQPGNFIVATEADTGPVKELHLVPASVDVFDPASDILSGTAPPNSTLLVESTDLPWMVFDDFEVGADTNGDWIADFGSHNIDLGPWGPTFVQARISDEDGDWTVVQPDPPKVDFTYSQAIVGWPVTFTDTSTSRYGDIVDWYWMFGDGGTGGLQPSITHIYGSPGDYEVRLKATDDHGLYDETSHIVQVRESLPISIDIKPGSDPNCINSDGHGAIPVALLGSPDFDATQVEPLSVSLDGQGVRVVGKGNTQAHLEDINFDGFTDMIVQIEDVDGTYEAGDTLAYISGELTNGMPFVGSDTLCVVP